MGYRNGTYVAFHAEGTNVPTDSDIRYFNLMRAWTEKEDDDFSMINSHEKGGAVRDNSKRQTLEARLKDRLRNSKHMVLIIGDTTKNDSDWVPMEIAYAVDVCNLPIIATYTDYEYVLDPVGLSYLWPRALRDRIVRGSASVIHIPFKKGPLKDAISQFSHDKKPKGGGLGRYSADAYRNLVSRPRDILHK